MFTFEQLKKANELIQTTDIKGKDYAEVNQRIKAFRSICPNGAIITELISITAVFVSLKRPYIMTNK